MLNYGSEANGLVASITQIIAYLSLLEAGVGAASIQALYRPIGQNDRSKINDILAATSIYYKNRALLFCRCRIDSGCLSICDRIRI